MTNTNTCASLELVPQAHPSFRVALERHNNHVFEMLSLAEAIQDRAFHHLRANPWAEGVEVSLSHVDVALACGREAAELTMEMAGLTRAEDGLFYSTLEGHCVFLPISQNLLAEFLRESAEAYDRE